MNALSHSRAVVACEDTWVCDTTIQLLAQCGITRAVRVRSAQALEKALAEEHTDVAILSTPMFEVGAPQAGRSFDRSGPAFIILTDGELQSVHRLMDCALDHRWLVSAILTRPVSPTRLTSVIADILQGPTALAVA